MSRIILGTMRWRDQDRRPEHWRRLLIDAWDLGIRKLHSSIEYASFELLCDILAEIRRERPDVAFGHIVKVGEPHFDEQAFDGNRLIQRIDLYRDRLQVDRIDDVQWMWRHDLKQDENRSRAFVASRDALKEAFAKARDVKAGRILCFPYSLPFAQAAATSNLFDGLVVYRNREELEMDGEIARWAATGLPTIVIRPFAAGSILRETLASPALAFALDAPGVEAAVLSTSTRAHLEALL